MILVFDPRGELLFRLSDSTFSSRAVVQRWEDLHRFAPIADCCVVFVRWLDEAEDLRRLERYRRSFPNRATVLVLERRTENLRYLHRLPDWEVVWLSDVERDLTRAVGRAIGAAHSPGPAPGDGRPGSAPDLQVGPARKLKSRLRPDDVRRWGGERLGP